MDPLWTLVEDESENGQRVIHDIYSYFANANTLLLKKTGVPHKSPFEFLSVNSLGSVGKALWMNTFSYFLH